MKKRVSIIVPIYNVQEFVHRCVDSLIHQTYENIEIIAVDDGSTDNCPCIVDEYSACDSRVVAIHKKNGGLSAARNAGLDVCSGDYLLFVDGDDWLDEDAVQTLVNEIEDNNADIVLFPYIREFKDNSLKTRLFEGGDHTYSDKDVSQYIFPYLIGPGENQKVYDPLQMDRLNTAWGKLYRKEAIEGIRFVDTQVIGVEDGLFNIQAISLVTQKKETTIRYTEKVWYHYEKGNSTSLLHSYRSDYFNKRHKFYEEVGKVLTAHGKGELMANLNNRIVLELFGETVNLLFAKKDIGSKSKILRDVLEQKYIAEAFLDFRFKKLIHIWKMYYFLFKCKMVNTALLVTRLLVILKG